MVDAFTQPFEEATVQGEFVEPDWTQPLRNLVFDRGSGDLRGDTLHVQGHVRLKLDTLDLHADEFSYQQGTGEMHAAGNVEVRQNLSVIHADELHYRVYEEQDLPKLLGPGLGEQERAKKQLSLGRIDVVNAQLQDPSRAFMADRIEYDFARQTGEIERAHGHAGLYYFSAERLRLLGPQTAECEDVWITTCDREIPHYRIRLKKAVISEGRITEGRHVRLQFGRFFTPLYWPLWRFGDGGMQFDYDSGRRAAIGYYVNVGQQFPVDPDVTLGLRVFPTSKEGVGLGVESEYDFMETPASPLFRGKGRLETLGTTEKRGHVAFYHRQEVTDDAALLLQSEQWSEHDFVKDFYYERYRNRTAPRTFANLTLTKSNYLASATLRKDTHDFVHDTERLPEVSYHLIERPLGEKAYFTFDTIDGYVQRDLGDQHAVRLANVARLSMDLDFNEALALTPFVEAEGTWYSDERDSEDPGFRNANTIGATLQTRLHKAYGPGAGFSGFKHLIVPSLTYSYRPETSLDIDDTPRFDAADNVYGRSRIETKVSNVLFGRDAETSEVWQVGRVTLYQGNDFWNERREADDYEVEIDVRPRPWWGFLTVAERHQVSNEYDPDDPLSISQWGSALYERIAGRPFDPEVSYSYDVRYGDYDRFLSYLYYDDTPLDGHFNALLGFAYTETEDRVFNRHIIYGVGHELGDNWGLAVEHRYDLERDKLVRQEYELRRRLHCWEMAVRATDRESGWDIGVEFNIVAFPGTKVKF